jgi:hypothetical protein
MAEGAAVVVVAVVLEEAAGAAEQVADKLPLPELQAVPDAALALAPQRVDRLPLRRLEAVDAAVAVAVAIKTTTRKQLPKTHVALASQHHFFL